MPVIPAMIPLLMGAGTAGAAAATGATMLAVAGVAMQGASMVSQNRASKASAGTARDVAAYNAKVSMADAKQVEYDMDANTRTSRREAGIYTSRQQAAYAASGVLSSGSPLAVAAQTASTLEQRILQERQNAGRESAKHEASARVGRLYGDAQASAIRRQNNVDMLRGGAGMLSTVAGMYSSGMFSGLSLKGANTSAGMLAAGAPAALASRSGL